MPILQKDSKDYILFKGRPAEIPIEEIESKIYDFLDSLKIDYKTLKHPEAYTMEECQKVREKIKAPVAKNLFLTNKQESQFYLLIMPPDKIFKTKYLSAQINSSRLSFANEKHMANLLGVKPGSVTPLGLINDKEIKVKFLIDSDLKKESTFACHPGINTASVVMTFKEFIEKIPVALNHEIHWISLPWE